jgi:hypothetical protein
MHVVITAVAGATLIEIRASAFCTTIADLLRRSPFSTLVRSSSLPERVRIERSMRVQPRVFGRDEKRLRDWTMDELDNPRLNNDVDAGNEA